jgi:hypothetical protein
MREHLDRRVLTFDQCHHQIQEPFPWHEVELLENGG